jgi:HEXXH motif-containing protein
MTTTTCVANVLPEASVFDGFAGAERSFDEAWLEVLLVRRRARLGALFVKCFGRTLRERARGLEAALMAENLDLETAWPSSIGQIRRAMLRSPADPHLALAAATAVALHQRAPFEVTLDRPESFLFDHHLLPPATRVRCARAGADVELELDGRVWTPASPLFSLRRTRRDVTILPKLPFDVPLPDGCAAAPSDPTDATRARLAEAFELLARVTPFFVPWIDRSVRALVPVTTPPGTATSSSFEDLPGVVALSDGSSVMMRADALVHEASHQHVHFLEQLGPVDDGTDEELYWSPARRAHRPIGKILLAYHAFVNVLRFWETCLAAGEGDADRCARMVSSYRQCCEELRRPLETTRALTPIGRALMG